MRVLALSLACAGMVAGATLAEAPVLGATKKAAPVRKAAAKTGPKTAAPVADPQSEHAVLYLKVLINALQSEQVKEEAKASMVACLYQHTLREITEGADQVFAQAEGKVSRDKPTEVFVVLTKVCGFEGDPVQSATTTTTQPQGR